MYNLENYRHNGFVDISEFIAQSQATIDYEQKGAREKFWFADYEYLFKKIFDSSYEDYAEVIATEFAKYFDIDCAYYDFATYNGQQGVITKNFVKEAEGEELISGTEVINYVLKNYINPIITAYKDYKSITNGINFKELSFEQKRAYIEKFNILSNHCGIKNVDEQHIKTFLENASSIDNGTADQLIERYTTSFETLYDTYRDFDQDEINHIGMKSNNLFDLWSIIDIYVKMNNLGGEETSIDLNNSLYNIFIFDMITLQGDRHPDNWGIIVNKKTNSVRMAPLFDNSNIFNLNRSKAITTLNDTLEHMNTKMMTDVKKERLLRRIKGSIYHPTPRLAIDDVKRNDYLKQALTFAKQYSSSDLEGLERKLIQFDDNAISFIFSNIQSTTQREIPAIVKNVVSETIKINCEELLKIIREIRGERSVEYNGKNS